MGEVGLHPFAGDVDLLDDHLLLGAVLRSPQRHTPLPSAQLDRQVPIGMPLTQLSEQRGRLQRRIARQVRSP